MKNLFFLIVSILIAVCFTQAAYSQSFKISGIVKDSTSKPIGSGKIILLKKNSAKNKMDTVSLTNLKGNGSFLFPNITLGNYFVIAVPNTENFPKHNPTYFGNTLFENKARILKLVSDISDINIIVKAGAPSVSGPGRPMKGVNSTN